MCMYYIMCVCTYICIYTHTSIKIAVAIHHYVRGAASSMPGMLFTPRRLSWAWSCFSSAPCRGYRRAHEGRSLVWFHLWLLLLLLLWLLLLWLLWLLWLLRLLWLLWLLSMLLLLLVSRPVITYAFLKCLGFVSKQKVHLAYTRCSFVRNMCFA